MSTLAPVAYSAEFLLDKAADFYCASMEELKPNEMNTYERGLMEGMALGFVMGQYPEQAEKLENMDDEQFNKSFYTLIKKSVLENLFFNLRRLPLQRRHKGDDRQRSALRGCIAQARGVENDTRPRDSNHLSRESEWMRRPSSACASLEQLKLKEY